MFGKPIFETEILREPDGRIICHVPSKEKRDFYFLHCETGPAIINHFGKDYYYFNGMWLKDVKSNVELEKYVIMWKMNRVLDK